MLRKLFPGYLGHEEEELNKLIQEAVIFIDASSILNFYEYSVETYEKFRRTLISREFDGRIFITYQVGLEYSRNRHKRIDRQNASFGDIEAKLDGISKEFSEWINKNIKLHSLIDTEKLKSDVERLILSCKEDINQINRSRLVEHHIEVDKFIEDLIGDRVTPKPSIERLKSIYDQGRARYSESIPPGFKDDKGKGSENKKFGDLIGWLEIIEYCKASGIDKVILIIDDAKEDWWHIESGKVKGPHPLLIQEMLENGITYYQYASDRFLKHASDYAGSIVEASVLEEIKEVSAINNNIQEVARLFSYTPGQTLMRLEAMAEIKQDREINSNVYHSKAVEEIERFVHKSIDSDRNFNSRYLGMLQEMNRMDPPKSLSQYLNSTGESRARVVAAIIGELRVVAEADRARSLKLLRARALLRKKPD